jgi:hypothetical protein
MSNVFALAFFVPVSGMLVLLLFNIFRRKTPQASEDQLGIEAKLLGVGGLATLIGTALTMWYTK